MRILVWGINYAPEKTGIGPYNASLCEFLAQRGHDVTMLTGFEYYPHWKKNREDEGRIYRDEIRSGVSVHRCWLYVPRQVRAWKRIVHEFSFVANSFLRGLWLKPADIYIVISPPLLLGLAAAVLTGLKRAPFLFHIQDLQPDAAVTLGMVKVDGIFTRILYQLESLTYRHATRISAICPGILRKLGGKRAVASEKLLSFPNWLKIPEALPQNGAFRQRHGIARDTFIVLYSGNLGVKQGLGVLIDAARALQGRKADRMPSVKFVIAGAGASRDQLAARIEREGLANILLLPLQPDEAYHEMLVDADCCAITQQPGTGSLFFPSKLLTSLAFGKPILSIADEESDLAQAVKEGNFGINVPCGSPSAVVEAVDQLASPDTDLRTLGERSRSFAMRFETNAVLSDFEVQLERLVPAQKSSTTARVSSATPVKREAFPE
jgi:colanic acid biosynthesis glycosyl transferase WcaI